MFADRVKCYLSCDSRKNWGCTTGACVGDYINAINVWRNLISLLHFLRNILTLEQTQSCSARLSTAVVEAQKLVWKTAGHFCSQLELYACVNNWLYVSITV